MANYASIINNATSAYNNTLAGYQKTLAQQQQAQQGTMDQYNALQKGVLGGLEQSSNVAGQAISNQYKQDYGRMQASMVGRGLMNTSVQDSMATGLGQSAAFAQNDRMAKYAQMAADKTTQLGLAGLGYQGQAQQSNLNFAGQGLQYAGQGAAQIGQLGLGFAGLENQQAMQAAQLAAQARLANLAHTYGAGGGGSSGGGGTSGIPGMGGPMHYPNNAGSYSYGGYGGPAQQMVPDPRAQAAAYGGGAYGGGGGGGMFDQGTSWDQWMGGSPSSVSPAAAAGDNGVWEYDPTLEE